MLKRDNEMNLKKSTLSIALATIFSTATSQAAVIDMDYNGLFTLLDPAGNSVGNTSLPYYDDPTWGYGVRTQISGTLQIDTDTGYGMATVNSFEYFSAGLAITSGIELKSIGGSLLIGNMLYSWNSNDISTQVVLDASGLFAALSGGLPSIGTTVDQAFCTASGACATPASDGISAGNYRIGPVPIATTSFNTTGQTGYGTILGQLSLGSDDGIGGSPMDNGPTSGFNANFDMTSLTVSNVSAVPLPAAAWLFGSGLLTLMGFSRRRKIGS